MKNDCTIKSEPKHIKIKCFIKHLKKRQNEESGSNLQIKNMTIFI